MDGEIIQRTSFYLFHPCPVPLRGRVMGCLASIATTRSNFLRLLLDSTEQRDVTNGRALHARILKTGLLCSDNFLANNLLNLYAKCQRLPDAELQFGDLRHPDVVSWNCLITGYAQMGSASGLRLFRRMLASGTVTPNPFTFAGVFTAAARLCDSAYGKAAHAVSVMTGCCVDVFVGSSLLNMYCKVGLLYEARKVFDRMPQRNGVSWTAMISGYAVERRADAALELFLLMRAERVSTNEFAFTAVLSAFVDSEDVDRGRQVHGLAVTTGSLCFMAVGNALVTMYAKCGCLLDSLKTFELSSDKNAITWSAIITAHAQNDKSEQALKLFSQMQFMGMRPSEFTLVGVLNASSNLMALVEGKQIHGYLIKLGYDLQVYIRSAMVDMYAKCGSINDAREVFDQLREPDLVLWSSMIGGYVQNGDNEEALVLYGRMEAEGLFPNELTMASVLKACSSLAALEQGKQMHARTIKYGLGLDGSIGSALLNMYAKGGSVGDADHVFERMRCRDVISWNSMISALSQNGRGKVALELFEVMQREGTKPDSVTFVNLISACSHLGWVERGWSYLKTMQEDYGMIPRVEHYACVVDLLSRSGKLNEAKDFIESVPVDHGMCLWRILLSAGRNHRKFDLGAYAGEKLLELGSRESSAYVLLSSIYAACGQLKDVERVRRMMKFREVNKDPGCSWMELKNRVHVFLAGDESHPRIQETYAEVRRITKHVQIEGYRPSYLLYLDSG